MNGSRAKIFACSWIVLVGALSLALAGCSGGPSLEDPGAQQFSQTKGSTVQLTSSSTKNMEQIFAASSAPTGNGANDDYRIAPLDVLEISVFGVPELNRSAQVSLSGLITLPLVKNVQAGGRTSAELEREIAKKLQATYMQSPEVSVYIKEYNSQRITVDGAVNSPGIFPIKGKVSLLQAIALSGGLNSVADPSGVMVFRTVGSKRLGARFDIREVRSGKKNDPMLEAGDIVMVDESAGRTWLRDVKEVIPLSGLFTMLLL